MSSTKLKTTKLRSQTSNRKGKFTDFGKMGIPGTSISSSRTENPRPLTGKFRQEDYLVRYLPFLIDSVAHRLLVWHVDDAVDSNTDEAHPKVALVQADGLNQLQSKVSYGDAGDPFPGTSNTIAFTSTSNPNSRAYSGDDSYVSITSIPSASPSMTLDVTVKPQAGVGPFDSKVWYRLKNTLAGYALDINNDGSGQVEGRLILGREGNYSGQYWQIKAREDGSYQIRNLFLGPNRALDVYGDDKNTPYVADIGYVSGQYWSITPWGDGSYHLENEYSGMYLSLDSMEGGTRVAMNSGPNAGRPTQRWTFTETGPINEAEFLA